MKNVKKTFTTISILLVITILLSACGANETPSTSSPETPDVSSAPVDTGLSMPETTRLSFGTASIGGVSYLFGSTLSQVLNNGVENLEISPEVTGGPVVNIGLLQSGQIEIGHVTDSTSYEAFHGTEWAEGDASPDIRGLFPTYPSAFQAFAIKGKGINKFSDLSGKVVGYGPAGSSGDVVGHNVFRVLGITPKQDQLLGWADVIGNMKDDIIEAAVDVGGFPHNSRLELEATHDIQFLTLTDEEIAKIQEEYPYYILGSIPAGTYKDLKEDYNTLFIWNEVICNKSLDDDVAYMLTKAAFELQPSVAEGHVGGKTMLAENVSAITIPLHPGAIKYYEEIGIELEDWHFPKD
ncbi:MAG TPA: TAXI family TRAP transporter solute-binding subunit [Gallicola sp.]|nr:TAXI family TRAP transporter solute-binding subunit [Gallicola sp.]